MKNFIVVLILLISFYSCSYYRNRWGDNSITTKSRYKLESNYLDSTIEKGRCIIRANIFDARTEKKAPYGIVILKNIDTSYYLKVDSVGFFQMQFEKGIYEMEIATAGNYTFYLKNVDCKDQHVLNYHIYLGSHVEF